MTADPGRHPATATTRAAEFGDVLIATLSTLGLVLGRLVDDARRDPRHFLHDNRRLAPAADVAARLAQEAAHTPDPSLRLRLAAAATLGLVDAIAHSDLTYQ
jgi:hypothetical protein